MKAQAQYESFLEAEKLEIVYGQVISVENIEKSDKMIKLSVDFGEEYGTKTILSAIKKEVQDIQSLNSNCYFFVLNFEPRKMMGILSEGMIHPFKNPDGSSIIENSLKILPIGTKLF